MPGATTRTNSRVSALTESETKMLGSLPSIESDVSAVLKSLAALVSEAADREDRLNNRFDELSRQVSELKEEVASLKESAIAAAKAPQPCQPGRTTNPDRTRTDPRTACRQCSMSASTSRSTSYSSALNQGPASDAPRTENDARPAASPGHNVDSVSESDADDGFQQPRRRKRNKSTQVLQPISDDAWKLIADEPHRAKRAVVYVGNLSRETTEDRLREFVDLRSRAVNSDTPVVLHTCSMHVNASGCMSARAFVDASSLHILLAANFWPRPLYCRRWTFHTSDTHKTVPGSAQPGCPPTDTPETSPSLPNPLQSAGSNKSSSADTASNNKSNSADTASNNKSNSADTASNNKSSSADTASKQQ